MVKQQKKITSNFIGKQISRFKLAMSYLTLAMTSITALMLVKAEYEIQIEYIIAFVPLLVLITIFAGYLLDKWNISTQDQRKSNEMTHRFLLTSDMKGQQFALTQTKMLLMGLQSIKEGKDLDIDGIMATYEEYLKKWSSPDSKNLVPNISKDKKMVP
ncbi:hypothetical protein [Candidatus Lokiarchaeum ossiferum]|uniref:hypothetical protein n=1 Tax=Candidatus Lokiarchaeum ossiferum TaxID=2951803 RepID=UPI00352DBF45